LPPLHGLIRGVPYFYTSPNIVSVMKSIRILGRESVTFWGGEEKCMQDFCRET